MNMIRFPKASNQFERQFYYYAQRPINKTVSFRLPAELAHDFNKAVEYMGSKSSDELRNFMIDYISFVQDRIDEQQQYEQRGAL